MGDALYTPVRLMYEQCIVTVRYCSDLFHHHHNSKGALVADIMNEQPSNSNETESDDDERDPGSLDATIAQLLNSDTEDEEFDGFVEDE